MVVPVEKLSSPHKIKRYVGNDLNLNISNNKKLLIVTGNNCKVKLSENSGHVKVVGDYCDIKVSKGSGHIEYIGNYGKIKLGQDVSEEVVTYIGNGGEICTDKPSESDETSAQSGSQTKSSKNHIDICNVSKIRCKTFFLANPVK